MPQVLMITQKIYTFTFPWKFEYYFFLNQVLKKNRKLVYLHLASTNPFSCTQNKKTFNGIKVNK